MSVVVDWCPVLASEGREIADPSSVSKGCLGHVSPNSWEDFLLEFSTEIFMVHTGTETS